MAEGIIAFVIALAFGLVFFRLRIPGWIGFLIGMFIVVVFTSILVHTESGLLGAAAGWTLALGIRVLGR